MMFFNCRTTAAPPPRAPYSNLRRRHCRCRYVIDFPILLSSRLIINCRLQCYHVCVHVSLNLIWWDVQTDGAPLPEDQTNKQTNKKERKRRRVAIQTKNQQKTAQRNNRPNQQQDSKHIINDIVYNVPLCACARPFFFSPTQSSASSHHNFYRNTCIHTYLQLSVRTASLI